MCAGQPQHSNGPPYTSHSIDFLPKSSDARLSSSLRAMTLQDIPAPGSSQAEGAYCRAACDWCAPLALASRLVHRKQALRRCHKGNPSQSLQSQLSHGIFPAGHVLVSGGNDRMICLWRLVPQMGSAGGQAECDPQPAELLMRASHGEKVSVGMVLSWLAAVAAYQT